MRTGDPTRDFARLSRLFDAACALAGERRPAWLAELAREDPRTARRIAAMLEELDAPRHDAFLAALPPLERPGPQHAAGDEVGPYRLVRELGRGGMGAVWLAERSDGAYARRVALKLPVERDDAALQARMALERDIAARLEHPNIVRFYDAGVDARGSPYLAFEHVDGLPIDRFCRAHSLDAGARVRLFVDVVEAVAHAHAHLVVHRDLKPSNVLVGPEGRARLLDFGVSSFVAEAGPQPAGLTPAYASPEQLRGERPTVASDVYSLGRLLGELLAGDAAGTCAPRRMPRELAAIVACATAVEPQARYPTAQAMASELRRYLAGEAVSVAGGTLYRAGKTLRRHRLGFALAALAIVGLLAAVAVAVANAREAESARRRAELVKDFIVDVFDASASGSGDNARLRQLPAELLLERGARMIDARFPADAAVRADLDGAVARIFVDMASPEPAVDYARRQLRELQALRAEPAARARAGLLLAQALLLARQATQAAEQASAALALAPDDAETGAGAHLLRAAAMLRLGRDRDVEDELTLADAALHAHPGLPGALRAQAERLRANRLNYLHNQFDRSLPLYRAAIAQALASEGPASPIAAGIRADLAYSLVNRHRGAEGMAYLDELLRSQRAIGGDDDVPSALAEASIAKWMYLTGQAAYEPTRRTLERDGEALRAHARRVPAQMAALLDYQLAAVEAERGLSESAYGRLSRDVPLLEQASDDRWSLYDELATWAGAATDSGRDDEALRLLDHALEVGAGVVPPSSPWLAGAYAAKARVLARLGRRAEALDFLRRLPSIEPARGDVSAPLRFRDSIAIAQAQLLLDEGRPREALATLPPVDGAAADDPIADRRLVRGAALCALGRREEGAALMSAALQRARAHHDGGYRPLRDWQARRERCLAAAR